MKGHLEKRKLDFHFSPLCPIFPPSAQWPALERRVSEFLISMIFIYYTQPEANLLHLTHFPVSGHLHTVLPQGLLGQDYCINRFSVWWRTKQLFFSSSSYSKQLILWSFQEISHLGPRPWPNCISEIAACVWELIYLSICNHLRIWYLKDTEKWYDGFRSRNTYSNVHRWIDFLCDRYSKVWSSVFLQSSVVCQVTRTRNCDEWPHNEACHW